MKLTLSESIVALTTKTSCMGLDSIKTGLRLALIAMRMPPPLVGRSLLKIQKLLSPRLALFNWGLSQVSVIHITSGSKFWTVACKSGSLFCKLRALKSKILEGLTSYAEVKLSFERLDVLSKGGGGWETGTIFPR